MQYKEITNISEGTKQVGTRQEMSQNEVLSTECKHDALGFPTDGASVSARDERVREHRVGRGCGSMNIASGSQTPPRSVLRWYKPENAVPRDTGAPSTVYVKHDI